MEEFSLSYQICLEAEDVSVSRIQSSVAFIKNLLAGSGNYYLKNAKAEDESSLDEYVLRIYLQDKIQQTECIQQEDAKSFAFDLAQLLEDVAGAHSYLAIEGRLSWKYGADSKSYRFCSESGMDYCDICDLSDSGNSGDSGDFNDSNHSNNSIEGQEQGA